MTSWKSIKRSFCLIVIFILSPGLFLLFQGTAQAAFDDRFQFESPYYGVNESDGSVTLTLYRKDHIEESADVKYRLTFSGEQAAEPGLDFAAGETRGTVAFAAGEITKTINIPIIDDEIEESTYGAPGYRSVLGEYFGIELYQMTNGFETPAIAHIIIWDNDQEQQEAEPFFRLNAFSPEVGERDGLASVYIQRMGNADGAVTVDYEAVAETGPISGRNPATANEDFTPARGVVTFADGEWWKRIDVPVITDSIEEGKEVFRVALLNQIAGPPHESDWWEYNVFIENNKSSEPPAIPNTLTFYKTGFFVSENAGSSIITVTRDYPTSDVLTIDYATRDEDSALSGSDYEAVRGTLTFGPGETEKNVLVPIIDDHSIEGDEYFFFNIFNPVGAEVYTPQRGDGIFIVDNDMTKLSFQAPQYNVIEEDKTAQLTVVRTGSVEGDVSIQLAVESVTAQQNSDFTLGSQILTFKSGERTKIIAIKLIDDARIEYRETFIVKLTNPVPGTGVSFGTQAAEVVIYDKDHLKN